jgi:hypothetical protein
MLTLVVRSVPVGVAYAIWAGLGIVMVSVAALVLYGQKLDVPAMLGMGLIVLRRGGDPAVLDNTTEPRPARAIGEPVAQARLYCALRLS